MSVILYAARSRKTGEYMVWLLIKIISHFEALFPNPLSKNTLLYTPKIELHAGIYA